MSIADTLAYAEIITRLDRIEAMLKPKAVDLTGLAKIDIPDPPPVIGRARRGSACQAWILEPMNLADIERDKYDAQWREPWYREKCHGLNLYQARRDLFPTTFATAVDFGSGTGRLVKAWRAEGINARGFDISKEAADPDVAEFITIGCLWDFIVLEPFDVAVCADVMEHIPPEHVTDAISCIAHACHVCVFKIANFPSSHDGRELHLTLQPRGWWAEQLSKYGSVETIDFKTPTEEYVFRVTF